ncbi:MAG: carbohydrate-binding protein [Spirochaetales bacterium]|nr:carbohydrate-binding protein [Spirochaetales bacterium]
MKRKIWLFFTTLSIFIIFHTYSLSLYVSPDGSDTTGNGSIGNPYKTLTRVKERVRILISGGLTENVSVQFMQGTYYDNAGVIFTEFDSPPGPYSITYENYGDAEVYIVNGSKITGWADYNSAVSFSYVGPVDATVLYENREKGTQVLNTTNTPLDKMVQRLTRPGDYYYDSNTQIVYYYARNNPPDNQCIFFPAADSIIQLKGSSDASPIKNIQFIDLIFVGTTIRPGGFTNFYNEAGIIFIENAIDITIDSCEIIGAGVSGIVVNKYARNNVIQNNRIDTFNLHGISLRGYLPGDGGYASPEDSDVNHNNSILNNFITSLGNTSEPPGSGIRIIQSGNNVINKNRITDVYGNGIMIHGPDDDIAGNTYYGEYASTFNRNIFLHAHNNKITNNNISRITLSESKKGGGIYLYQPGENNTISANCIHNISTSTLPYGIYIDDLAESAVISRNVIHTILTREFRGRSMFVSGNNCTIENNVFSDYGANTGGLGFFSSQGHSRNLAITSNIFHGKGGNYIYFFEKFSNPDFRNCNNNIFYHPTTGQYQVEVPGMTYTFSEWQAFSVMGYDNQSRIEEDPRFEEPESHYYRVQTGSPALAEGFTNISQQNIGLENTFAHIYASDIIEAEKYIDPYNIDNRITTIQSSSSGSYTGYGPIYFNKDLKNVEIRFSCNASSGIPSGRTIEIHSGSSTGPLLCSIGIPGTGGITNYNMIRSAITYLPATPVAIYMKFTGGGNIVKVDWFRFYKIEPEAPVIPDNIPPNVKFETPPDGKKFYINTDITITASATDADGNVVRMWLYSNDNLLNQTDGSVITFTMHTVPEGTYVFRARAVDNDGAEENAYITINVSTEISSSMTIRIVKPTKQRFDVDEIIDIEITAEDSDFGIQSIQVYANGQILLSKPDSPLTYQWSGFEPGDYFLEAIAVNPAGMNVRESMNIWVSGAKSLVGHWTMDTIVSGYGNNFITEDKSGHENHAIVNNVTEIDGVNSGALYFDGNASAVTGKALMDNFSKFTIAGWIRPEARGNRIGFFGQRDIVSVGFQAETTITVFLKNRIVLDFMMPEEDINTWHHIALIGNGKGLRFYYDGIFKESATHDSWDTYGSSGQSFNIGCGGILGGGQDYNFRGSIDDVRLYNCAISETELKILASKGDNIRPDVQILYPNNGENFEGPADIVVDVKADDRDGYIRFLEIYNQEYHIEALTINEEQEHYQFFWNGVPPGQYILTARTIDNEGDESTHSISIKVHEAGSDLIAYWNFNEKTGTTAYDSSGNENHGTLQFTEWDTGDTGDTGVYGSCLFFDGYGTVETGTPIMTRLPKFTVAYWMKPTSIKSLMGIIGQNGTFISCFNETKEMTAWTELGGYLFAQRNIPLNEWSHIAIVGNGKALFIYFNGDIAARIDYETFIYSTNATSNFQMGGIKGFSSPGDYFQGYIDEVYIYKRDLSEDEIKTLARPPAQQGPSIQITSPTHMAQYAPGESVPIKARVQPAGHTNIHLKIYINDVYQSDLEEPYETVWSFQNAGTFAIALKGFSDSGFQEEDTVSVVILPRDEISDPEAGDGDNEDSTSNPDSDNRDDDYKDEYKFTGFNSSEAAHASEDEILAKLEENGKGPREGESFLEYVERIKWDKPENKKLNKDANAENAVTTSLKNTDNKGNNDKHSNTASSNWFSNLFSGNDNAGGRDKGNNGLNFIFIVIILLILIAAGIGGYVLVKKINNNRKKRYYYN